MATELNARQEILQRVRTATGGISSGAAAQVGWNAIERRYKRHGTHPREQLLELLEDRLRDYDATVVRAEQNKIARSVAGLLTERGTHRIVIPAGIPPDWLPQGFEFVVDHELPATELDIFQGVLTGSTVAIAETGTVILQNLPGQGRRAVTLVPDFHLCIVRVEDVVETVPEAMDRLRQTTTLATTFFSGPSATADIEMTRIKGVHGPRFLDIILAS
jgi:L-lactate dehydrogenase complex protein LldG